MTGIVDWATSRARMMLALVFLALGVGILSYGNLPKEGEPDIEIPALFVSVPFPGISAEDSERMIVRPLEQRLQDLEGLKRMMGTAAEGYGGLALEFEFGWDKSRTLADVRDRVSQAQASFPDGAEQYSINEINFSQFPILNIALSGDLPERTLIRVADDLRSRIESLASVLEVGVSGSRDEMIEVVIDPLKLEAYDVTANELIRVVTNNNQLIAAGMISGPTGAFAVKIPGSFEGPQDIYALPVKADGDRVVTLGDLAEIRLTFEDRDGTARYNGEPTVALQVVMRKGSNIIDTVAEVRTLVGQQQAQWPEELRSALSVSYASDQSTTVAGMISQLEGSVLTAIALVMIVVLAALGTRSALLVGFAIPTAFLLCFALFAVLGMPINNIVMFGLILAVGMLVDGAIVVVEYADKRIREGMGPMAAYGAAAKRMFWPITASTATTLCAFLPMIFWPGVAGEFMGLLPITLIFVLVASLVVALIFLPVVGGVTGRISRSFERASAMLGRRALLLRLVLVAAAGGLAFVGAMQALNPAYVPGLLPEGAQGIGALLPGALLFIAGAVGLSVTLGAIRFGRAPTRVRAGYQRTAMGWLVAGMVKNPVMPLVTIFAVAAFVGAVFAYYGENNRGVDFFVETEPERALVYVRARGNLSIDEKDSLLRQVEERIGQIEGISSVFAFAGEGGLNQNTGGAQRPLDTIGTVQLEFAEWGDRPRGQVILDELETRVGRLPGIEIEILPETGGPASSKPVQLRIKGNDWAELLATTERLRERFDSTPGLTLVEDTRPLPGIDWQINVDVEQAGRFGADVVSVGAMVQLVTRGLLLDTMRVDTSDEEIDIRVRLPESDRRLSTLETLKVRTAQGQVPLSNFISIEPVAALAQIDRADGMRYFDIKAAVAENMTNDAGERITATERIAYLGAWLTDEAALPPSIQWEWTGDQQEQEESAAFLGVAFAGALGLMFVILLAQFNSVYNSLLVLTAVVLSTTGTLIGMLVMNQPFSVIMTGTGIVALAGIVVNNNIVLIDTYQEYSRYMPRLEAIVRTVEARIRPVLLTTITTMAGLSPMMLGVSIDFFGGGFTVNSPTAMWWKQLATAVVFGLGVATFLTLLFTPSMLALRVWVETGLVASGRSLGAMLSGREGRLASERRTRRAARRLPSPTLLWEDAPAADPAQDASPPDKALDDLPPAPLRAAE
ncbi:MAG: efflux RND transporter permease subunit [Rhodobacteraceae bacterium]|nr:efflux RND transporter permease subunit [Paracoccaceae bacterium]